MHPIWKEDKPMQTQEEYFTARQNPIRFRLPRGVKPRPYIRKQVVYHRGYQLTIEGKESLLLKEGSVRLTSFNLHDPDAEPSVAYIQGLTWAEAQREITALIQIIDKELKPQ